MVLICLFVCLSSRLLQITSAFPDHLRPTYIPKSFVNISDHLEEEDPK